MASGIRRVRGRNGLRARDAAHGHTAVVAVIFVWTVFIVVVRGHVVVLVVLVVLVGAARLRLLLRLLQLFDFLSQFCLRTSTGCGGNGGGKTVLPFILSLVPHSRYAAVLAKPTRNIPSTPEIFCPPKTADPPNF